MAGFPIVGPIVGLKYYFQDMNILPFLIIQKDNTRNTHSNTSKKQISHQTLYKQNDPNTHAVTCYATWLKSQMIRDVGGKVLKSYLDVV